DPALVRFQASKELTEGDNVVVDYFTRDFGPGDRRACVIAVRKDIAAFYQALAKAAGLKLLTLTPRPFGLAGAVQQSPVKRGPDPTVAAVTITGQWAEFLILRGDHILYSRPLTLGMDIAALVRQNLAAFSNQGPGVSERDKVQGVYLFGAEEHAELR